MDQRRKDKPESEFAEQMRVAREIMDENWMALRALALRDQYPELDVNALIRMAEEQVRDHFKSKL